MRYRQARFRERKNADALAKKIRKAGLEAFVKQEGGQYKNPGRFLFQPGERREKSGSAKQSRVFRLRGLQDLLGMDGDAKKVFVQERKMVLHYSLERQGR